MFDLFERKRLVKRGLASAKVRRRRTESELVQTLEHGLPAKLVIFFGFVLGLWALIYSDYRQQPMEKVFIGLLIFVVALAQLWINHLNTWDKNSRLLLIFGVLLLHLAIVKAVLVTSDAQALKPGVVFPGELSKLDKQVLWRLAVPYALAPLTLSVLLGRNHGIYAAIFASLWSFVVYRGSDAKLLVMSLICGFVAVFVTLEVRRRSRLLRAGLFVGLATWVLAMVFGIIGPIIWEAPSNTHWKMIAYQSLIAVGSGLGTALLVGGALNHYEPRYAVPAVPLLLAAGALAASDLTGRVAGARP
jgi:predicted membrane channel-forming protein YqfA (hemolysin III family)